MKTNQNSGQKSGKYLKEFYEDVDYYTFSTIKGYERPFDRRRFQTIFGLINTITPPKILDIGCGGGVFVHALSKESFKVTGIDLSSILLHKIPKGNLNFNLIVADSTHLPFNGDNFDCILCTEVLEHVPDCTSAVEEISRVLRREGKVIITVPNLFAYDAWEGNYGFMTKTIRLLNFIRKIFRKGEILTSEYETHKTKNHIHMYNPNQWREKLENYGLKVIYDKPIYIVPYIPKALTFFKTIENRLYQNPSIFKIQKCIDEHIGQFWPFKYWGQSHLFVCVKR